MIYGGPFGVMPAIPAHLPPLFLAWAEDDAVAGKAMRRLETALDSSGQPAEVHIYSAGGHGFGLRHQGTSSDYWVEAFHAWLVAQGFGTLRR
jgi:predicted esterase